MTDGCASNWVANLHEFHAAIGEPALAVPTIPELERVALRLSLIREEVVAELLPAIERGDLPAIADGIVDAIYVLIGTALEFGINLHPVWNAVHAANMAKVGGPMRSDGKQLKPLGWMPPDIIGELRRQGWKP